jgi:hypothetical protein
MVIRKPDNYMNFMLICEKEFLLHASCTSPKSNREMENAPVAVDVASNVEQGVHTKIFA